jgi:hypothetical protein
MAKRARPKVRVPATSDRAILQPGRAHACAHAATLDDELQVASMGRRLRRPCAASGALAARILVKAARPSHEVSFITRPTWPSMPDKVPPPASRVPTQLTDSGGVCRHRGNHPLPDSTFSAPATKPALLRLASAAASRAPAASVTTSRMRALETCAR